jgi:alkanesulfonate monooxygenase SsuD/methylene tetrahydromethanopterin reductase-like flavin-dependent oxidoreductase (luciferase family)
VTALRIGTLASPALLRAPAPERAALVRRIVDARLDHVFVADHVSFHVGTGMDGLVNAATLTALHPDLTVCVGVYLLALRHPVTVARQLATLGESAPGRLLFGVGVGGEDRNEFAMCGIDPATRGRRTDECLTIVRSLLAGNAPINQDDRQDIRAVLNRLFPPPRGIGTFYSPGRFTSRMEQGA